MNRKASPPPRTPWHHRKRKGLCRIRKWRIVCWLVATLTMFSSHLERSPMKRRWDCSCAVLSFSKGRLIQEMEVKPDFGASPNLNAWIADRIGPPVLQSSFLKVGESLYETSRTLCQIKNHPRKNLGMWQEKIGQWGSTKDKIQEDQITMTLPNTGKWNRRREVELSNQKSEWKRQIKSA